MATDRRTLSETVWMGADSRLRDVTLIVGGSALLAALAQISVPLPFTPVPLTGQTLGVLLIGALIGPRRGAAAMLLYLLEGIAGLPVFALGRSGGAVLLGPTGGYLLAFPVAAAVAGFAAVRGWDRSPLRAVPALALADAVIFAVGVLWLARFTGLQAAVPLGLLPFLPGDGIKVLIAALSLPSGWALLHLTGFGQRGR